MRLLFIMQKRVRTMFGKRDATACFGSGLFSAPFIPFSVEDFAQDFAADSKAMMDALTSAGFKRNEAIQLMVAYLGQMGRLAAVPTQCNPSDAPP